MRGFVLAAGFGTRLRPLTDHIPKALVPAAGRPLLSHALQFLSSQGITAIGVNSHHLHEQLESFQERSSVPFELFYERESIRGTGGALHFARDFLGGDSTFCVCNVDILFSLDLKDLISRFERLDCLAALAVVPVSGHGAILYSQKTQEYCGVAADRPALSGVSEAQFIGLTLYRREFLDLLKDDDFSIVPVWRRMRERRLAIKVLPMDELRWCDIGTPQALARVHFDCIEGKVSLEIPGSMRIDKERKICVPRSFAMNRNAGPLAWIEVEDIPRGSSVSNSVVFDKAAIAPGTTVRNVLVTRWGEIDCG